MSAATSAPTPLKPAKCSRCSVRKNLDELIDAAVPRKIRLGKKLKLPAAKSEFEALAELSRIAGENQVFRSFIGMGYYDCITPPVIQRNVLENPGWYTQYTPYQAEISQGRLEALLNFQTMVIDLTGLRHRQRLAARRSHRRRRSDDHVPRLKPERGAHAFFVSRNLPSANHRSGADPRQGAGNRSGGRRSRDFAFSDKVLARWCNIPDTFGEIHDYSGFAEQAHAAGALLAVAADLLALTLLKPPGEFGADIAVGSAQRFGVPLGYGGPHAAFFATRDEFKRQMPGRIVGVSKDSRGKPALRLALGTREQHIRREKATSNICTAQALLGQHGVACTPSITGRMG